MKKFSDSEVRWGILGVGNVCEVKSAPAMNLIPGSQLVAVMRRDEEKVKDYAQRHGIKKWYSDAQALIQDPEVNAIYIATPPNAHLELTALAAKAGKPVYVEKPMARNHAECQQMIEICEQYGVPLFVAYYRRSLPHFVKIKELLDAGAIGDVRTVHINLKQEVQPEIIAKLENNWRIIPEISGGGYFFDLASHQLDLMDFFFGKITHAAGFSTNQAKAYAAEDLVTGSFVFDSGVIGTGNWCFSSSKIAEVDEVIIDGNQGQIRFATFGKGDFFLLKDGEEPFHFQVELPKHIQQPLIDSIVSELLGKGTCPSSGKTGARANWVMDELVKNRIG
ncbi:Gfo/Idh/MocA family protein [Algoriphagus mannitolivorans]|uniref:Gfo/Idh/MocA family protein n=1 Tax=Algoriphagus mannitolivorans TaxID=226504 RepID=UPI0003F7FA5B|nr:Gfo/Idh/MocA family oxidoreductase [Algoriphagus mannitolivorans]